MYGNESSGKTTIALHAVANAQKPGGVAAFIDAEHALDPTWAKRIGVDLESLLVSQPSYGEEALRIAEMLVKSNAVDIIVIDSVAALVPKNELNNEIGDAVVGVQARLMSQALRDAQPDDQQDADLHGLHQPDPPEDRGACTATPRRPPAACALKFYERPARRPQAAAIKDGDDADRGRVAR